MSYDTNNIFAKILRGEIPSHRVYEDEHTFAFMDVMPQANGHTLVYEYISKSWVVADDGTSKTSFTADTDTTIFDDSLMVSGLKVKFKAAKGLDVGLELAEFAALLDECKAQDNSQSILSMSPQDTSTLISLTNVPDGNFPAY